MDYSHSSLVHAFYPTKQKYGQNSVSLGMEVSIVIKKKTEVAQKSESEHF